MRHLLLLIPLAFVACDTTCPALKRHRDVDEVVGGTTVNDMAPAIEAADQVVVVEGEVSNDEFRGGLKVIARKVLDMATARVRYVEALRIQWQAEQVSSMDVQLLAQKMGPFRGDGCDVVISFATQQAEGDIRLGPNWKILPDDELIHDLQKQYGKQNVQLVYT